MHVSMVFIITVCVLIMFCLCKTVKINGHHVLIMFDGEGIGKKRWVERLCKLSKGILDIPFGKPNLLMENSVFTAFQFFLQECTYISTQHNMFLSRACSSVQRQHNQQHLKRKASAPDNTSSSSRKFCIFQTNRSPYDLKHTNMCQHRFLQNRCSTANKMLYTNLSCATKLLCMYRLSPHLDQIQHINLKLLCHECKHYL